MTTATLTLWGGVGTPMACPAKLARLRREVKEVREEVTAMVKREVERVRLLPVTGKTRTALMMAIGAVAPWTSFAIRAGEAAVDHYYNADNLITCEQGAELLEKKLADYKLRRKRLKDAAAARWSPEAQAVRLLLPGPVRAVGDTAKYAKRTYDWFYAAGSVQYDGATVRMMDVDGTWHAVQ